MIGEDLPAGRGEKPSTESIQVYFRSAPSKAQERVVMFVTLRGATAGHFSVVQSQSSGVLSEGEHNVDKADAGLVRFGSSSAPSCPRSQAFEDGSLPPLTDFAKQTCSRPCWLQSAIASPRSFSEVALFVDRSPGMDRVRSPQEPGASSPSTVVVSTPVCNRVTAA
jgi:hypothetical protein